MGICMVQRVAGHQVAHNCVGHPAAGKASPVLGIELTPTHLLHHALADDDDAVSVLDGAQAVRDDQRGAAGHHAVQRLLHHSLRSTWHTVL